MGVLKHKLWFDLWKNKGRTFQIVIIIAMGAAAIGMIIGTRELVIPSMEAGWQAINPSMINLFVTPPLDDKELLALKDVEGVVDVEGISSTTIEWRVNPDDEWQSGGLTARANYKHQKFNRLELVDGAWPTDNLFATEQGAEANFGIPENGQLYLRINDKEHLIKLGGTVYNQLVQPASLGGTAQFYTTREQYGEMVGNRNFNQFMATAIEYDEETVTKIADEIQAKLEKQEKDSNGGLPSRVSDPQKHFFQDSLDGIFLILAIMGGAALILGLLLVYNTVNTLITQQVNQIGIMKAIGATTIQIFTFYLINIIIYGVLALIIAVPVGIVVAWLITVGLLNNFNADPGQFSISPVAILVQICIALVAPLVASIIPIISGSSITVREAISTYGLSTKGGLLNKITAKLNHLSRMFILTVINTFRNKWRVVLLQITLLGSGFIFLMVISVRDSVVYTIEDVLFSILNYDISFIFVDPERISHIEQLTLAHPEVKAVEMWGLDSGSIRPANQAESADDEGATLFGVPLPTDLYGYQLRAGRWLDPADTHAIVLNQQLAEDMGVGVGDWVIYQQGNKKESNWLVVGLLFDPIIINSAHVPRDTLLKELGSIDRAQTIWIQTVNGDNTQEETIAKNLRAYYKTNQVEISPIRGIFGISDGATQSGQTLINQFNFIVILLGIMAFIIAMVGSIALSGSLSLSVMERRREIGVMRAIGASSWVIARLFIGEGLILGWLSWLISLPFSIPAGRVMLQALSNALNLDLVYNFTLTGPILWFIIITVLSIIASLLPARGATRISIRESLAYQ